MALNGRWWNAEASAEYAGKGAIAGATAGAAVGTVLAVGNAIQWAQNNIPGLWDAFKDNFWKKDIYGLSYTYGQAIDTISLTNSFLEKDLNSVFASAIGLVNGFPGGLAYSLLKGFTRNMGLGFGVSGPAM